MTKIFNSKEDDDILYCEELSDEEIEYISEIATNTGYEKEVLARVYLQGLNVGTGNILLATSDTLREIYEKLLEK